MIEKMRYTTLVSGSQGIIESEWPISDHRGTFHLYFSEGFNPPKDVVPSADLLGLVAAAQRVARRRNTGITLIEVSSHKIQITFAAPVDSRKRHSILMEIINGAGHPYQLVS